MLRCWLIIWMMSIDKYINWKYIMKRFFEILTSICLLLFLNITICGCSDMVFETGSPVYHHVYVDRPPIYIHPTPPPPHPQPMSRYVQPRRQSRPDVMPNRAPMNNNQRGHFGNGQRR